MAKVPEFEDMAYGTLRILRRRVPAKWIDHNGHMNVAAYLAAFDAGVCRFCNGFGIGPLQKPETGRTIYVGEAHLIYRREILHGSEIEIGLQLLDLSDSRLRIFLAMYQTGQPQPAAYNEQLAVCVDPSIRRPAPWPEAAAIQLENLRQRHASLPIPRQAGRGVQMPAGAANTVPAAE